MPFGARGVRPPITHPVIDGELRNVSNAFRREGRSPPARWLSGPLVH